MPPLPIITFKVLSQVKKGFKEGADYEENFRKYGSYIHELEIEPLDLEIEGMPPITRLVFQFADPLPSQIVFFKPLTKSHLYNSSILTEATDKTFTMKIKSFCFSKQDNSLTFSND